MHSNSFLLKLFVCFILATDLLAFETQSVYLIQDSTNENPENLVFGNSVDTDQLNGFERRSKRTRSASYRALKFMLRQKTHRSCYDRAANCADYIGMCSVQEYVPGMRHYCHMSCGYCAVEEGPNCQDAISSCDKLVQRGFCELGKSSSMIKRSMCAKSCNLCVKPFRDNKTSNKASSKNNAAVYLNTIFS
ncbi:hypothetical protein M3Y97_00501500 [Aphelenchoides bicaudatus]|nr:hypothetical protein M3Y97_00501500 [Aphelenchoides bicaudatus]